MKLRAIPGSGQEWLVLDEQDYIIATFNALVKRSPYDETSGKPHPADDVYNADVWGLVEQYKRDNPSRAYFPREKGR